MIILIRDNECFEPRVRNYINYFRSHGIDYHVIAWNRNGTAHPEENITFFSRRAEYGKRLANIPNKLAWMWFASRQIWKWRKGCTVIHACDIDAVIPALFMRRLTKKKVIFDIFDWISSLTGKGIVYKLVEGMQNWAYAHSDAVILCEEERKAQARASNPNVLVLPNIPDAMVPQDQQTADAVEQQRSKYDFTISYVGVFDRDRGLENLLRCVSRHPNILLNIAGFGVLDNMIREYAENYPNIYCWGRVEYPVGQAIQKHSDMIAAMYHLTSPLHKYAAPNKYYESLYLEVPMITTENTLVGTKVAKYDTGFVLDESETALDNLLTLSNIHEQVQTKAKNCRRIWETVYQNYYDRFMTEKYLEISKRG